MSGAVAARRGAVTVVIPAHNEAAVVSRGLRAILEEANVAEFDVLVVSNGSTDDTAAQASRVGVELGHLVRVLEIPVASKIAALRAAEESFRDDQPVTRIYVDADVVVGTTTIRLLAAAIDHPDARVGLVRPDVDTSASGLFVRSYYRAWAVLARARAQGSGSGVLALNAAGARRVSEWPAVLNDDGFVVRQFAPAERVVVDAMARQYATRSIVALVKRRARVVNGNRELDARWPLPSGTAGSGVRLGEVRAAITRKELGVCDAVVYVGVTVAARALAGWRRRTGGADRWSRDASSRQDG